MRLAAVAVLWLLGGCREQPRPQPEQTSSESVAAPGEAPRALEVGVSGCAGLVEEPRRGHLCLVRPAKKAKPLHLWLHGASDLQVELRFAGVEV
ncbi:MAG TPA: hypothetical protein VK034_20675, partial [Enhygromyxa sp.]|nr:hypothetical protein [Enhygromyxa sp.]